MLSLEEDEKMSGKFEVHTKKRERIFTSDDFAASIQKQADTMAQAGWTKEASSLRQWAMELKGKISEKGSRS